MLLDVTPQAHATSILGKFNPGEYGITSLNLFYKNYDTLFAQAISKSKYKNLDLIPSNINLFNAHKLFVDCDPASILSLKCKLDSFTAQEYDFIIIDCPPDLGGPFVVNAMFITDYFIIPVDSSSQYALFGMDHFMDTIKNIRGYTDKKLEILGFLITKYDPRATAAKMVEELTQKKFGTLVFNTRISKASSVEKASLAMTSVIDMDPRSTATKQYKDLAKEVLEKCGMEFTRKTEKNNTDSNMNEASCI